jgi:hypothetical protein
MMLRAPALTRAVKAGELIAAGRNGGAAMYFLEQAMEALLEHARQVVREEANERPR